MIISRSEIERMKRSTEPMQTEDSRTLKKAELKEMSNKRVESWPNTLEALRKKKETFTRDREEREEKRRQEIDREEAELRKTMRLESIRRANELLYEQTDKMKMLKSQKLYCDVLDTRQQQIGDKKSAHEAEKERDHEFHLETIKKVRTGEQEEKRQMEERKKVMESVAISRQEQLTEIRSAKQKQQQEEIEYGVAMKQKAAELLEEEVKENVERMHMIRARNEETLAANVELKRHRERLLEQEREAAAAREAEIKAIEDRKKNRKAIEIRRFEKQQEKRQQLIDIATKKMMEFQSHEEEILMKQINDQEEKEARLALEKEERAKKQWEETVVSRNEQIEARKLARKQEKEARDAQTRYLVSKAEEAHRKETEADEAAKETVRALKSMQLEEATAAQKKKITDRLQRIEQQKVAQTMLEQDERKFTQICEATILDYTKRGKPIFPLMRALEHTQPDLLAAKTVKLPKRVPAAAATTGGNE